MGRSQWIEGFGDPPHRRKKNAYNRISKKYVFCVYNCKSPAKQMPNIFSVKKNCPQCHDPPVGRCSTNGQTKTHQVRGEKWEGSSRVRQAEVQQFSLADSRPTEPSLNAALGRTLLITARIFYQTAGWHNVLLPRPHLAPPGLLKCRMCCHQSKQRACVSAWQHDEPPGEERRSQQRQSTGIPAYCTSRQTLLTS